MKTGMCFRAYGADGIHSRGLCHVPRALMLYESPVGEPGFCCSEDVLCVENNLFCKVWKMREIDPERRKYAPRQRKEGAESSGGKADVRSMIPGMLVLQDAY